MTGVVAALGIDTRRGGPGAYCGLHELAQDQRLDAGAAQIARTVDVA